MRSLLNILVLLSLGGGVWLLALTEAVGQTYSYDPGGQLTAVSYPSGELVRYTYDDRGNKIRKSTFTFQGGRMLVLPESEWTYLDVGAFPVELGTPWTSPLYDDSSWFRGNAKLGHGSSENTTVQFGPDPNNKHITTYFRKRLVIPDPGALDNLVLHVLRDDGAVVYVNGTEVYRGNMPAGTITDQTLALEEVQGPEQSAFQSVSIDPSLLVAGNNVIAAEVHLAAADSPDLAFDLALEAAVQPQAPTVSMLTPFANQAFFYTSNVVMQASAFDGDGRVLFIDYYDGPTYVGRSSVPPYRVVLSDLVPGPHNLFAIAVDDSFLTASSATIPITIIDPFQLYVPRLSIRREGDDVVVSWEGTGFYLQTAEQPEGPWTTLVPNVVQSPFTISSPETNQFFRLKNAP